MENLSIIILSIVFFIFLYFGYKDDYKRDKRGFKGTIVGVIGTCLILFCCAMLYSFLVQPIKIFMEENEIGSFGLLIFDVLFFIFGNIIVSQYNNFVIRKYIKKDIQN